MTEEETVLHGMIDRLIEIGRCIGKETNVEKSTVMRISGQLFPAQIMIDRKQVENVECFKHFRSMINVAGCTLEFKSRIAMTKAAFSKKKTLFTSKLDFGA
jgi:hypothetical protein